MIYNLYGSHVCNCGLNCDRLTGGKLHNKTSSSSVIEVPTQYIPCPQNLVKTREKIFD